METTATTFDNNVATTSVTDAPSTKAVIETRTGIESYFTEQSTSTRPVVSTITTTSFLEPTTSGRTTLTTSQLTTDTSIESLNISTHLTTIESITIEPTTKEPTSMEAAPTKPTSTKPATEPIRSSTAEITESEISTAESLEIDEDILGELLALSNEELIQLLDTLKANSL